MKRVITLIGFLALMMSFKNGFSQDYGVSLAFSTNNMLSFDFLLANEKNRFHIGFSTQFNGQKNAVVRERGPNYGLTRIGNGDSYWLVDFGYGRQLGKLVVIQPEIGFGGQNFFTNYSDGRFRDGGYSLITKTEIKAAIGINCGILLQENIEFFLGLNTIKKLNFGFRYLWKKAGS